MSRPETKWMPLNWADYWRDTGHLSATEHGAYINLIGAYWVSGGPLPANDERLRRLAKCSEKEWKASSVTVLEFFHLESEHYRHDRIDRELADAKQRSERRASAGQAGGLASAKQRSSNAVAMLHTKDRGQETDNTNPKDLISRVSKVLSTEPDWTPERKKAAWQSKVCLWAQAELSAEDYAAFLMAWTADEPLAVAQAERFSRAADAAKARAKEDDLEIPTCMKRKA